MEQAVVSIDGQTFGKTYIPDAFTEKFAELIVRGCADYITEYYDSRDEAYYMKKHFGVEERKGWVCPKCGVDRTREACPRGHTATMTGDCPMTATAQSGVEE
jgi:hypothetical protein